MVLRFQLSHPTPTANAMSNLWENMSSSTKEQRKERKQKNEDLPLSLHVFIYVSENEYFI